MTVMTIWNMLRTPSMTARSYNEHAQGRLDFECNLTLVNARISFGWDIVSKSVKIALIESNSRFDVDRLRSWNRFYSERGLIDIKRRRARQWPERSLRQCASLL